MRKRPRIIAYGVGIWAVPFAFGMLLFPVRESLPTLFDAGMTFALVAAILVFGVRMIRTERPTVRDAIAIGSVWSAVCLFIDLPMFSVAFDWPVGRYLADVGIGYALVPLVMAGLASASRATA